MTSELIAELREYVRYKYMPAGARAAMERAIEELSRRPQEVGDREQIAKVVRQAHEDFLAGAAGPSDDLGSFFAKRILSAISTRAPSVGERQPPDAGVEVLLAAYKGGYKDGYVDARYSEDEEQLLREIDSVAVLEGFDALRDALLALSAPVSEPSVGEGETAAGDREQIAEMTAAVDGISSDYMTSEDHHPGWVLIPETKFRQLCEVEKALSQPRPEGEMREGSEHGEAISELRRYETYDSNVGWCHPNICDRAADTIEALVRENEQLRARCASHSDWVENMIHAANEVERDNDALRSRLKRAEAALREIDQIGMGTAGTVARSYFASLSPVDGGSVTPLASPSVVSPTAEPGPSPCCEGGE